jgi:hypothetical protein
MKRRSSASAWKPGAEPSRSRAGARVPGADLQLYKWPRDNRSEINRAEIKAQRP